LPMLQLFAEHSYHENVTREQVEKRFEFCTSGNYTDFMILNQLDETPGVSTNNLHESNPSKFLLWQDPLIGLYDKNIQGLELNNHYKSLIPQLKNAQETNGEWKDIFIFYEQLAEVLSIKAELGINLKSAYEKSDSKTMSHLFEEIVELKKS